MLCIHETYTNIQTHRRAWIKIFHVMMTTAVELLLLFIIVYFSFGRFLETLVVYTYMLYLMFTIAGNTDPPQQQKISSLFNLINLFYYNFSNENAKLPNFILHNQFYFYSQPSWLEKCISVFNFSLPYPHLVRFASPLTYPFDFDIYYEYVMN